MATPQNVSKLDMSLDEIIKMNKKVQHKGKQKSKGPSRAQGGGKGGQKKDGGGKSSGNDQSKLKPTAKKARQNAKRTQNPNSGTQGSKNNKRRMGNTPKNRQRPAQSQSTTPHSTGIKSRLGMRKVTATKGKQQVVKQIFTSHGQNRGGKSGSGKGPRPGSRMKIIRELKAAQGNPSNRARGNAPLKELEAVKDLTKHNDQTPKSVEADKRTSGNQGAPAGRGRKQGGRGGRQGGRGKTNDRKGKGSPSEGTKKKSEYSPKPMPSVPRLPPFDPPGVDLPLRICMDHHTSQPLHRRFTPQLKGQSAQRLVQKGGRTINYSK